MIKIIHEDYLNEGRTGLNKNTSKEIKNLFHNFLSGKEVGEITDRGQTALLKYLITNRNISIKDGSKLLVHHINFDHDDYRDENLCILTYGDHNKVHNTPITETINHFLPIIKKNEHYKNRRELTPEEINKYFNDPKYNQDMCNYFLVEYKGLINKLRKD